MLHHSAVPLKHRVFCELDVRARRHATASVRCVHGGPLPILPVPPRPLARSACRSDVYSPMEAKILEKHAAGQVKRLHRWQVGRSHWTGKTSGTPPRGLGIFSWEKQLTGAKCTSILLVKEGMSSKAYQLPLLLSLSLSWQRLVERSLLTFCSSGLRVVQQIV